MDKKRQKVNYLHSAAAVKGEKGDPRRAASCLQEREIVPSKTRVMNVKSGRVWEEVETLWGTHKP